MSPHRHFSLRCIDASPSHDSGGGDASPVVKAPAGFFSGGGDRERLRRPEDEEEDTAADFFFFFEGGGSSSAESSFESSPLSSSSSSSECCFDADFLCFLRSFFSFLRRFFSSLRFSFLRRLRSARRETSSSSTSSSAARARINLMTCPSSPVRPSSSGGRFVVPDDGGGECVRVARSRASNARCALSLSLTAGPSSTRRWSRSTCGATSAAYIRSIADTPPDCFRSAASRWP
mmetsp:Transcript_23074/g.91514  ORF Transcript_23074/g.91514 Transcript_23074/m.91514 type:complete len:233 (-) Transcript_23074:194-892(-)